MDKEEFVNRLKEMDNFEAVIGELDGVDGVYVKNNIYDTETHFSTKAISSTDFETILLSSNHGKNVEHMTRVTGYFSKISGWNKGKQAELKDRSKTKL